jgi:hypothetical protein
LSYSSDSARHIALFFLAIFLELLFDCFEANWPDTSTLERVFNRTNSKGLFPNLREVCKEGAEVVFRYKRSNYIYYLNLLVMLLCTEATHITRLKEMCLMRGKLDYPDLTHLCLNNKVIYIITSCTIN